MPGTQYSDKKKTEAVVTYLAMGKLPLVSAVVDVPVATLRQWKLQPWWKELEDEIRREDDYSLDAKLSKIIDKSLDAVVERIEGGEFILDSKTGTIKRIPVKLKDVHRVAVDLVDKRNLIRGKPKTQVDEGVVVDTMQKLAETFAQWAIQHMRREEKVVAEYAVHDQREEGLREGVQQVPLAPQTEEKPSAS